MARKSNRFSPSFSQRGQQSRKAKAAMLARLGLKNGKKQKRPSSSAMTAAIQQLRSSASWLTRQQAGGMNRRVRELEGLAREARKGPLEIRLQAASRFEKKLSAAQERMGSYELERRNQAWESSWSASVRGLRGEMDRVEAAIFRKAKNEAWLTSEARLQRGASYMEYLSEIYGTQDYEKIYSQVMAEQQGAVQQASEWLADQDFIPTEAEEERYKMVISSLGLIMA